LDSKSGVTKAEQGDWSRFSFGWCFFMTPAIKDGADICLSEAENWTSSHKTRCE
jgi:hypothetical protein